ncbi:MAG: hemolysin family protein [Chloroflexota bacterium]
MAFLAIFSIIIILILINGLYVAAEFSTVSVRRARLAQMADTGNRMASGMLTIIEDPKRLDAYVAACQLGITVSSLVLGFYGQSRIMALLEPWLITLNDSTQLIIQSVLATFILLFLTILQVIFGELIPKNLGIRFPERLSVITSLPMQWSLTAFKPLIWLFNGSGRIILGLFGVDAVAEHTHVHSPAEIRLLVEESGEGGLLDDEERRLLVNTLELRHQTARKVMIPRNQILVGSVDQTSHELLAILAASPYSRLPVYQDTIDQIVGVVHIKDLLRMQHKREDDDSSDDIDAIMYSALHVPDSMPIGELMAIMQSERENMVVVVDEYGGTAGLITFEDIIEEIIGEFRDEFDGSEIPPLRLSPLKESATTHQLYVRGDVMVDELNEWLDLNLSTENSDTIGGLIVIALGRIPEEKDHVVLQSTKEEDAGLNVTIDKMDNNRIVTVRFAISPEQGQTLIEEGLVS